MEHRAKYDATADRAALSAPAASQPTCQAAARTAAHEQEAAAGHAGRVRALLMAAWRDRRIAVGVAVPAAGGYALLAAWWTPRGPVTTLQAVAAIVVGLLVGTVAG